MRRTKIVATIGPASREPAVLERLIQAGVDMVRLNFSHGDLSNHAKVIARVRAAAKSTGQRVAIMADLPGPKMRLGRIDPEPIHLLPGEHFTLTSKEIVGNAERDVAVVARRVGVAGHVGDAHQVKLLPGAQIIPASGETQIGTRQGFQSERFFVKAGRAFDVGD